LDNEISFPIPTTHACALELSGTNPQKRNAITVRRIHIGLYLKANPEKSISSGSLLWLLWDVHGRRCISHNASSNSFTPKFVDGAAEENRVWLAFQIFFGFRGNYGAFQQSNFLS